MRTTDESLLLIDRFKKHPLITKHKIEEIQLRTPNVISDLTNMLDTLDSKTQKNDRKRETRTTEKKKREARQAERERAEGKIRLYHMEQSINPHAYCRLRFDEAAEEAIENLANVLQWHRNSPFEGLFVAQKDARAGARVMSSSFF